MNIKLTSKQSKILNSIAMNKRQIELQEKNIIDYILAGEEIDQSKIKSIEIKDDELIIELIDRNKR